MFKKETIMENTQQPTLSINEDGDKHWWVNDKRHREDGPAVEDINGDKFWYINGKLHRKDGPAVEYSRGGKEWWLNGNLHRTDGPAIDTPNGYKEWYIDGKELTEEEFEAAIKNYVSA